MKLSRGAKFLSLGVLLVIVDQIIKILVKTNMCIGEHFSVFGDWFQILFVENEGMAFGMKFGGMVGKACLTLFRIVLCSFLIWWIAGLAKRGSSQPRPKDISKPKVPTGVLVGLTLVTAGAFGNIVDSLVYGLIFSESTTMTVAEFGGSYAPFLFGKVVDMFYFPLFTWPDWLPLIGGRIFFSPVFNFADSCVSVGAIYLLIFQYKFFVEEEEFEEKSKKNLQ